MEKEQPKAVNKNIINYTLDAEIGHGASGVCYKAVSKLDKKIYAIKKIAINTIKGNSLKLALTEVQVLKTLKHPNIIKYHDSFADQNYLYIVMEYAQRGDLHTVNEQLIQMLKRRKIKQQFYTQAQIWDMGKQLLLAIKYLHSKNIVHRDLKTLNIFIGDKNNLLVGDLGVSKIIKNDMGLYSRVGTPLYLAPEIIKYEKYDYKADIWSFGCVMYVLTSLSHPFEGKNIINLGQNILFTSPKPIPNYSDELNTMIKLALEKNPLRRPDANSFYALFYSQELEKVHNPQNLLKTEKKLQNQKNIIVETKVQQKPKQQKFIYCCQNDGLKKDLKQARNYFSQIVQNRNKNITKVIYAQQQSKDKQEETVALPQPLINKVVDGIHQITRVRNKQKNQFIHIYEQQPLKIFPPVSPQCSTPRVTTTMPKEIVDKTNNKEEKIRLPTEPIKNQRDQVKQEKIIKLRNIQSASFKPVDSVVKKSTMISCRIHNQKEKYEVINSTRQFFQSEPDNMMKKSKQRPKSSIGRRGMTSNHDVRHFTRHKTIVAQDFMETKTELLNKPQFIIV